MAMAGKPWQEIAAAKKAEQASRIPAEWKIPASAFPPEGTRDLRPYAASVGILTEKELEITGEQHDATALVEKMAAGAYTAVEVVTAFCKRAAIAQQLVNPLTEIMFKDAIEGAKELDAYFKETGKIKGPLHGIPMTFKECFHFKGYDASDGYISRCFEPSTYDSYLVDCVRAAGAVVIAKTNCPQTMLVAEADNNVFGRTKNPVVSHLTCGGSSGGEGAVLAFRGSALGIGTDVGGSIRIPSAANGIYGYKPTFGILSMFRYAFSNWQGMNTGIPAVCGPMGHSLRDLELFIRTMREQKPWLVDPSIIPHVFEAGAASRKPKIGVVYSSGITPHPPITRAIKSAAEKLKAKGFEVVDFTPPLYTDVREVTAALFTIDGLSYAKRELGKAGEPHVPSVANIGFWDMKRKEPEEIWAWNAKKIALQTEMLERWQKAGIDMVLAPAGPHTAVLPGEWTLDHYTVNWNAMDYPAVIIPYGTADPTVDVKTEDFKPLSELDAENWKKYDAELLAGAPVALQLVGARLQDEQLLKDVAVVESALKD